MTDESTDEMTDDMTDKPTNSERILEAIHRSVSAVSPRVVAHFRHLHRHPELGWKEAETAAYVEQSLRDLGLETRRIAGTGVVVDLPASGRRPRRLLRADLDAVATHEQTGLAHSSCRPGVMHACGHDAHTSILLGVVAAIRESGLTLERPLRFLFQPAEEVDPSGAQACIAEGVLEDVRDVVGLHVWPGLSTGIIGLRDGVITAAADRWECELRGPGGHAARPHETIDLIRLAARLVGGLVDLPRTLLDPLRHPTVITVANIQGGEAFNVIPDRVRFGGTVRTLDPDVRSLVSRRMESLVRGISEPAGAEVSWVYHEGAPALRNDPSLVHLVREVVPRLYGEDALRFIDHPSLGSEDFSHFTEEVPGLLLRLGCTPTGAESHPLHSSYFVVDEEALRFGVGALAGLAML